jgi:cyanophycin synthetase
VLSAPGDRRDEDILAIARIAAGVFDHVIVRRDDDLRGRAPGEVVELLRRGLIAAGLDPAHIDGVEDEQAAIDAGLRMGRAGDLLLVFGDNITRSWKQIIYFGGQAGESRAAPEPAGAIGSLVAPVRDDDGRDPGPDLGEPVRDELPRAVDRRGGLIVDDRGVRLAREEAD